MAALILPDVNLLIYAYDAVSQNHYAALGWWEHALLHEHIGLPVQTILSFIRLTTHPRVPANRFSVDEAHDIVDDWLTRSNVIVLHPGTEHWLLFRRLCLEENAYGNLSTDAHLGALAIEHNATLYSNDRDFSRFSGLRWTNPLQAQ